jgi:AcrR family transcriptional regulator
MPKKVNDDEVFKAVIKILVTRGYDRATMLEIAQAANIHEATLFRKYGSKVGLIEQAIENQLSKAPLSKVIYTGDLHVDLSAILNAYIATFDQFGEIVPMVLMEIPRYPELRGVLQTPMENIHGLANIITRYQEEGVLKEEPAFITVNALLAPLILNQLLRGVNISLTVPPIDLEEYVEAFLEGRKR